MSKARRLYIDFEFSGITKAKVDLVSCATYCSKSGEKIKWWLFRSPLEQKKLAEYLKGYTTFITYSAIAECRSFIALGLDPLDFEWVDLFLEYRLISNHNDNIQWGKQLVDGKVKHVRKPKPKWERTEEDIATGFKATHSLAEATYKLTGQIRDTEHKTAMRDLIISYPESFSIKERADTLEYNMQDVVFLKTIESKIREEYRRLIGYGRNPSTEEIDKKYPREARGRGRYAAHTAWMETRGYPINVEATRNFSKQVGNILYDTQREINTLFPEIKPFKWKRADNKFSWDQKITRAWISKNHEEKEWMKTGGGQLSLSLEAFEKKYSFKHSYPKDNFGAQLVRFLKLKQSLYGFSEAKDGKRKTFWDYVGEDGRVRPYMNIFGAQSGRSQPAATGFMFLKPAWMRSLVQPSPGKFMAGIDYGSQEFFASALMSGDRNMIQAYLSGDPYLAFGKLVKMIPKDGTKETHGDLRNLCKATVLGLSYLMTKYGLAIKLTNDTGKEWTEDMAQEQIDLFYEAFEGLGEFQQEIIENYSSGEPIRLRDGWTMWADNENFRSVTNIPVQGLGSSVMRRAVDLNHSMGGSPVAFTLHDALYIEEDVGKEKNILILRDAMREAFVEHFPGKEQYAEKIKLDPFAWSPDYEPDSTLVLGKEKWKVPSSNLYIDDRSHDEWKMFSQYFDSRIEDQI